MSEEEPIAFAEEVKHYVGIVEDDEQGRIKELFSEENNVKR